MIITVTGAGNIGTLMAAEMAHKGHEVTMYSSKPEKWNKSIEVLDKGDNLLMTGELKKATNDLSEAVSSADLDCHPVNDVWRDGGRRWKIL